MTAQVLCGDSRALLAELANDSVDSCVTDPPYELTSGKRGGSGEASLNVNSPAGRSRIGTGGFMGARWDATGVAHDVEFWREVFRVLKPGAHLAAFGGTRTYHRMAVAIEDAGFDIRDQLAWVYGSGFPKSLDVSKAIGKAAGAERGRYPRAAFGGTFSDDGGTTYGTAISNEPATDAARQWQGWGTALKPAWEPICLARKPLAEGTVAANVLAHGTGAINVDACRVGSEGGTKAVDFVTKDDGRLERWDEGPSGKGGTSEALNLGRFPANLCHDGSEEVLAGFPSEAGGGFGTRGGGRQSDYGFGGTMQEVGFGDSGSAARFFYSAKAGKLDRLGSDHPTVKPVDLMRWLVRLVTPPGGTVLDPFAGSGSTGIAAHVEGFDAILMELRPEAVADIERRLAYIKGEGRTTAIEAARLSSPKAARKARGGDTPLFSEPEA